MFFDFLTIIAGIQSPPLQVPLADGLLVAFDERCGELDAFESIIERAEAANWQQFEPDEGSGIDRLMELAQIQSDTFPHLIYESRTLRRANDQSLVLIATKVGLPESVTLECRVVATQARQRPLDETVARWSCRDADTVFAEEGYNLWDWEPGIRQTHSRTGLVFVTPESSYADIFPSYGLAAIAFAEPNHIDAEGSQ